ncbi:hypothetical protein D3C71_1009680 [compost metagenome]
MPGRRYLSLALAESIRIIVVEPSCQGTGKRELLLSGKAGYPDFAHYGRVNFIDLVLGKLPASR